jgi:hypothetical protein
LCLYKKEAIYDFATDSTAVTEAGGALPLRKHLYLQVYLNINGIRWVGLLGLIIFSLIWF